KGRPKPTEVCVGFSRDGFHWHRADHRALIPVSETQGDWNWGNVQSAGGCCLIVGDQLYFYVSGRAGVKGSPASGVSTTGLAVLRRDGFASMGAGETERTLMTRPVTFRGKHLFVNVAAEGGELRAAGRRRDEDRAVIGATNRIAGGAAARPVTWGELFATLYHSLGIDAHRVTRPSPAGRNTWSRTTRTRCPNSSDSSRAGAI